jgi:glycosyltransferase involved in cell wall biosynthesis
LRCSQVAEYLHGAGHEVRVLTSSARLPGEGNASSHSIAANKSGIRVDRWLRYYTWDHEISGRFYNLAMGKEQLVQARRFSELVDEFQPDIVNWWNLEGLTKAILPIPAMREIPDVHWIEDMWNIREYGVQGENEHLAWFNFWRGDWGPQVLRPFLRRTLALWERAVQREGIPTRPFLNQPGHVCFVSEFMRFEHLTAGLVFPSSEVIYGGISPERFYSQRAASDFQGGALRFLYAGYVEPNRRLHTIIEAIGLLPQNIRERIELSVANSGLQRPEPYVEDIKRRIGQLGLTKNVNFLGKIRHEEMPRVYREHHVLVSATTRPEGLPMTMMEAMCAGCAVVTTGSGGAIEIADRADLPVFPRDHPVALSRLMARLVRDRELVFQKAIQGQQVVLQNFTFARMMADLIQTFRAVCAGRQEKHGSLVARQNEALRTPA